MEKMINKAEMKGKAVFLWHKTDLLIGELWVHLQDGGAFCPQGGIYHSKGQAAAARRASRTDTGQRVKTDGNQGGHILSQLGCLGRKASWLLEYFPDLAMYC